MAFELLRTSCRADASPASAVCAKPATRFPTPKWTPVGGWKVDPALVYAHALQESSFRTAVVSPAGATGLLQVRPGTAGDIARARGESFDRRAVEPVGLEPFIEDAHRAGHQLLAPGLVVA